MIATTSFVDSVWCSALLAGASYAVGCGYQLILAASGTVPGWYVTSSLLGGAIAGTALALQHRQPRAGIALVLASQPLSLIAAPALWLTVAFVGQRCARKVPVVLLTLVSAAVISAQLAVFYVSLAPTESWTEVVEVAVCNAAVIAVAAIGAHRQGTLRRRGQATNEMLGDALDREASLTDRAQHRERQQLARELHDSLGLRLAILRIYATSLHDTTLTASEAEEVDSVIETASAQALEDLHHIVNRLGRGYFAHDDRTLESVLDAFRQSAPTHHLALETTLDNRVEDLTDEQRSVLVAFLSEALTNALKYAGRGTVIATACAEGQALTATVSSPIASIFNPRKRYPTSTRIGLRSLQSRARSLGGDISILATERRYIVTLTAPAPVAPDSPTNSSPESPTP